MAMHNRGCVCAKEHERVAMAKLQEQQQRGEELKQASKRVTARERTKGDESPRWQVGGSSWRLAHGSDWLLLFRS